MRPSRRLRWRWPRLRERKYAGNRELHAYEEEIVMRELLKRGGGSPQQWHREEPGRWRKKRLEDTFGRLQQQKRVDRTGRSVQRIGHVVYVTTSYVVAGRVEVTS